MNQRRRHAGGGHLQAAFLEPRQGQGHAQLAQVHALEGAAEAVEGTRQVGGGVHRVEQALGRGDQRPGLHAVAGGVADGDGQGAVVSDVEVVIVAADLGGGVHAGGDLQVGQLGYWTLGSSRSWIY